MSAGGAWTRLVDWLRRLLLGGIDLIVWYATSLPADLAEA